MKNGEPETGSLLTFEFVSLCMVLTAAFCTISVFYSFYHYLGTIGIPVAWRGFLVGLEAMAAFGLRLFVLPWLHVRNALTILICSMILSILVSCSYLWVTTVAAMFVLRVVHGAVFVAVTASAIALIVNFIPKGKSGQGFGVLSVAMMIPYAVIPSLAEALLPFVRSDADLYAASSIFSVAALIPLAALRSRIGIVISGMDDFLLRRLTLEEIRINFRIPAVRYLLSCILLVFFAHATGFYFIKNLSLETAVGDVGLYFTISITAMIAIRVFGASHFDRTSKPAALQGALALLIPCLILLPHAASPASYYLLAVVYGLCIGIGLPLLNALLFSASSPSLRGFNTNMAIVMQDGAFFLMPYLGGMLITQGARFGVLFYVAAGFVLLSLLLITALRRRSNDL